MVCSFTVTPSSLGVFLQKLLGGELPATCYLHPFGKKKKSDARLSGKEDPVEFDSSLTLCSDMRGVVIGGRLQQ